MVSRHDARRRALAILYEADVRDHSTADVLAVHEASDDPPPEFASELVRGVAGRRDELDAGISAHAVEWRVERMPVVDRNLLRLGLWEIRHSEVPDAVAIDEAVELAKELSTDDSGRFVNGVLARAAASPAAS
ncbi:transcription antitermination factor NusB [Egibacter rhizosphaerae]|uniref:Transcription antitermination protein NusB n=1 Tax=Egibacter rhizosphaerae TaxID=1670831 RepID=A0A411YK19_9ACTN|nr:transcription antitermination factor NusB [Egibacter rhizosphaerae]QBI21533.1 transcription antitermination factor NusB [Egibacter rhizosphaerae]